MITRLRTTGKLRLPQATTWLAWLLPVFAWAPLTYPGYFEFHSGFLPIFNLNDLARHLADLSWAPVIGQPYDLLRGERVLPYMLGLLPRASGASGAAAVKWVFGVSILAGALGMYGWARRRLGLWPGLLAALVYAFWPLGLATVYVRGALAEAVLLGLMPLLLWAADAAGGSGRTGPAIGLGLALAAALWTQTGLALWLAVLVLVFGLACTRGGCQDTAPTRFRGIGWGWLGGMVLGGLGLLPLILHRGLGGGTWVNFVDHFVYLYQLLLASWGQGPSIPGPYDTLTFQLGLVACGLAVLGIANGKWQVVGGQGQVVRDPQYATRFLKYFALAVVLVLAFLSTTLSASLWKHLPFLARTLTYPWQLLLLTGPWLAWLAGLGGRALLDLLPDAQRQVGVMPLFAILLTLTLLGSYGDLNPPATDVPVADAPVAIFGDDQIALLSVVTAGKPGPGGHVTVLARWQALRPLDQDYTVFFHVETPDRTLWGQTDTMPHDGQFPTSQWPPGQVVTDKYQLTLKSDAPISDDYRYTLGLYLWQTGQRLPIGTDDKVVLTP